MSRKPAEVETDYERDFDTYGKDVLGDDDSGDEGAQMDKDRGKKRGGKRRDEEEEKAPYMLFDFRRGLESFPQNVELVNAQRANELLEKATKDAEEAAKLKKKEEEDDKVATVSILWDDLEADEEDATDVAASNAESTFEKLKDGSTALILKPGYRLKLNVSDINNGGDATREERKKKEEKMKKAKAKYSGGGGDMAGPAMYDPWEMGKGGGSKWFKEYMNEYTITMDIRLLEEPPRDGIALFNTALVHSKENKRTGKTTVSRSDGECMINQAGGVGMFGTFGDTTKAKLEVGQWKRVVVAVKCADSGNDEKGEMRTWVNTEAGVTLKDEAIEADERFAIDPENLYLFSAANTAMMPGNIAIRTVRVEKAFASDADVKANRARDKVLSIFNEERKKDIDAQRQGLALAVLFPKPRPMWAAPTFVALFGDAFVENSVLESNCNLPWSYLVYNLALQNMKRQSVLTGTGAGLGHRVRVALSDTMHIMQQSLAVFKLMQRLLTTPTDSQLLSFLRKLKRFLTAVNVGETLMLPAIIESSEIVFLFERTSDRAYKFVIVQTDAEGLFMHAVSPVTAMPAIQYRTCLVLTNVPKKNALDDVFWMALYNMSIVSAKGDMQRFYDILLPFLTGKPLEASLVESERAAAGLDILTGEPLVSQEEKNGSVVGVTESKGGDPDPEGAIVSIQSIGDYGSWRTPQRSNTSYLRCIVEATEFLLLRRGVTALEAKQIHLGVCCEMVAMMKNDLRHMLPDESGVRVCELAVKELSHFAVNFVNEIEAANENVDDDEGDGENETKANDSEDKAEQGPDVSMILSEVYELVESSKKVLELCKSDVVELPPVLEMKQPETSEPTDPALTQYRDTLCWDVINSEPDPGQAVALRKYIPIDFLQIPKKATSREEAVTAIRFCDKLCTLVEHQDHCIKNNQFLVASMIEHVFVHVVPVPKPRGVNMTLADQRRAKRSELRAEKKAALEKQRIEEKKKLVEEKIAKGEIVDKKRRKTVEKDLADAEEKEKEKEKNVKCFGEEELPDFDVGKSFEEQITEMECIWDDAITYELQVELLLTMQRLAEQFAAAVLSIQQSRSFDGVIIVVNGCMVAVADAIMRKVAIDEPSEATSHLSGRTLSGKQLGHPGFGISAGSFASQSETIEVHTAELNVARTAVLDYFNSPEQKRLEKMFSWEENFFLPPGKSLIKYIRNVGREIGLPNVRPYIQMVDACPMASSLMKIYPELKAYRDIVFFWKYFMNTDRTTFPNYVDPTQPRDLMRYGRMQAQLVFTYNDQEGGYQVNSFAGAMRCRPDPKAVNPTTGKVIPPDQLPTHRFPSTATPSFYVPQPMIKTEDDVIYRPNLPSFEDKHGQVLNQRDSELLISYLTVPYMRLPLLITFFASDDRIHKLQSEELRMILDSVMFEPGKYLRVDMSGVEPMMVPTPHTELLATPFGLLMNELCRSPDTVVDSILSLLRSALACDTGSVVDEGADEFNTSTTIILYISRLGARVDNYMTYLIDIAEGKHDCHDGPLRENDVTGENLTKLKDGLQALREFTHAHFNTLFEDYLKRLDAEVQKNPLDETLIDRNSRLACDLQSHKMLLYRNYHEDDLTADIVKTITGSFVYLTTRHTWNKTTKEGARLQMPETELYELLTVQRRRMVVWLGQCKQGILDVVMQTSLQVSSSLTGSLKASAQILDNQNRWSRITGERSIGRFAVGSTRSSTSALAENADGDGEIDAGPVPVPGGLQRQTSYDNTVGEVNDNGMLGVEIDVQVGQMTLRSKHLAALTSDIANNADVALIFGDATMQASLIEKAEHRHRYRLVGLNHELEYWPTAHNVCPPLGDEWEREYDPAALYDSEKWIASLFEPLRKNFFDGPEPPPMQFMMPEKAVAADAEVAVILGLHQKIGGPFKLVYLFRRLRCVHIYECLSQGREYYFSLHLTTDYRFALRELGASTRPRRIQFPDWWIRGAGAPYPMGVNPYLSNDGDSPTPHASVLVIRQPEHHLNLTGGRETLVPSRLLYGVVPEALLDAYNFWQDESIAPRGTPVQDIPLFTRGYKRLLGYPVEEDEEYMIVVEFFYTGDWLNFNAPQPWTNSPNVVQATQFPGRTVRVLRRPKAIIEAEFRRRQRVGSYLESMRLLAPPAPKKKRTDSTDVDTTPSDSFKVDTPVEYDEEGNGDFWPCVVIRVNDNGSYDLEFVDDYAYFGVKKGVDASLVQKRGTQDKKSKGEGVFHWEGMTESEDDDWRDDTDEDQEDEDNDSASKKNRLTFYQIDELDVVLKAAGDSEDICMSLINRLAAVPSALPFTDVQKLAAAMKDMLEKVPMLGSPINEVPIKPLDCEDMQLLNLLYAPRRTGLYSIMKTLARIENLSHICAWTKRSNFSPLKPGESGLQYACPPIDFIDLPRLKLAFTARPDHEGIMRLYSVDHVDLYITNERNDQTAKMLAGIQHSILLSNVRGETKVLVPVATVHRPRIFSEPFSTFTVLDRTVLKHRAERFFLYPVHVSLSFLLTKGLNSAVYLMLLRFLHRDYADVFRLADSIATDTQFNLEGSELFKHFGRCNDDWHPDAHACRLKISLVTIDSGSESPWDLTTELARHSVKLDSVSSSCRLAPEEELQLLESDKVATSNSSPAYDEKIHTEYMMALVYNRLNLLRSLLNFNRPDVTEVPCRIPPRSLSSNWPFYADNTVFGENYLSMIEVTSVDEGDNSWLVLKTGGDETDAPEGGWLVVAVFHTLWSASCITVLPAITELVPMYQDMASFTSIRADGQEMVPLSKEYGIKEFPTVIFFRGGHEVERIEGSDRLIDKMVRALGANLKPEDKIARAKHRHRIRLEQALERGEEPPAEEEEEERGQLDWTWDPEQSGESLRVESDGMRAVFTEDEEGEQVVWEYSGNNSTNWKALTPEGVKELEKEYKQGTLYNNHSAYTKEVEIYASEITITTFEVSGFTGYIKPSYRYVYFRRRGDRCSVPGEDEYLTKEQKERDKRAAEWREKLEAYRKKIKEQKIGNDIEGTRGTIGILPNTGIHFWTLKWNHEPSRGGTGDGIGVCTDAVERYGPCPTPLFGSSEDVGASLALYANGELVHNGKVIHFFEGKRKDAGAESQDKLKAGQASTDALNDVDKSTDAVKESTEESGESKLSDSTQKKRSKKGKKKEKKEKKEKKPKKGLQESIEEEYPLPPEEKAPLFGFQSLVKVILNTDEHGGVLSFEVDGEALDFQFPNAYRSLGGQEIFPCVCMAPLDPVLIEEKTKIREQRKKALQEAGENQEDEKESDSDEDSDSSYYDSDDDDSDDDDSDEEDDDDDDDIPVEKAPEVDEDAGIVPSVTLQPHEDLIKKQEEERAAAEAAKKVAEESVTKEADDGAKSESADGAADGVDSENAKEGAAGEDGDGEGEKDEEDEGEAPAAQEEEAAVKIEKVRWMYEGKNGWEVYNPTISRELEEAARDGKSEYILNIGEDVHKCNLQTKKQTRDEADDDEQDAETEYKMRRHILTDGLSGQWEILTMKYEKPAGTSGQALLKILNKIWPGKETMSGKKSGLGFLFLYSLLSGEIRAKVLSADYGGGGGGKYGGMGSGGAWSGSNFMYGGRMALGSSSNNDAHRFGLLMTQLYADKHTKSLPASVIHVLGRNRQVSLRMPKFKDNRKASQTPFFNGWIDEQEPRSPVAELFAKIVPMMTQMKRKGAFHFPPPPPYLELPRAPESVKLVGESIEGGTPCVIYWDRPELSDYGCGSRLFAPIEPAVVANLAKTSQFRLGTDLLKPEPPIHVEDTKHLESIIAEIPDRLYICSFGASWCSPCKSIMPLFRMIALRTPTARFLKIDIEECDDLAEKFSIEKTPTIVFLRGGSDASNEVLRMVGLDESFVEKFFKAIEDHSTPAELSQLMKFASNSPGENVEEVLKNISTSKGDLDVLARDPLSGVMEYVTQLSRKDLGLPLINPELAFDVNNHEHAKTAPAASVLTRFKDDVAAYANATNTSEVEKMVNLSDRDVQAYFDGDIQAETTLTKALEDVKKLMTQLNELKDMDLQMIQDTIPLLEKASNWVPYSDADVGLAKTAKTRFLLNRYSGQNAFIWCEFLFGSLLSSCGEEDLLQLNPYLSSDSLSAILNLVTASMLRANRLGHTNRCIGTLISLQNLLTKILKVPIEKRSEAGDQMAPKLIQSGSDLAKTITTARHYMTKADNGLYEFDPRYLVFEFVWNIQLRKKQVEIVNDFIDCLANNRSKVKQMIMGAGKTSVVAPLLALIVADGKSLVLSVVPKALVEMSRKNMRETFAAIMVKRIYTLEFDRSTTVRPAMRRSLENAAANRGVVVCTPTTLKSVMLSYVETLQHLKESHTLGMRTKVEELKGQAEELAKILKIFNEGTMLLDEVDLILHPLKSELNFPIGDKFDLDGSEEGERWSLPIHLLDAIFYTSTGRVSSFEQRGIALDILKKIAAVLHKGMAERHMQKLPHVTLLNLEYYTEHIKPVMAEWAYLWLQKQHLHGIDRGEAVRYMLEGAAARSDSATKVNLIDVALNKIRMQRGDLPSEPPITQGFKKSMSEEEQERKASTLRKLQRQQSEEVEKDEQLDRELKAQIHHLEIAKEVATKHRTLVNQIYDIDEQVDQHSKALGRRQGETQSKISAIHKKIEAIECQRDDSLDNCVVVWYSQAFASMNTTGSGAGASATTPGETSVPSICNVLEDAGLTVRRCGEPDEAISRARDLQKEGQLRCLILGGDEQGMSCGPACVSAHTGQCLKCKQNFSEHNGHNCRYGGRGTFLLSDTKSKDDVKKLTNMQTITALTDEETPYARANCALPVLRTAVYCAHNSLKEAERMSFWKIGTTVTDDHKQLITWVNNMPAWHAATDKSDEFETPQSDKAALQAAAEKAQLVELKIELEKLEKVKASEMAIDDSRRKMLLSQASEHHAELEASVQKRISELEGAENTFIAMLGSHFDAAEYEKKGYVGPHCGRDCALACGWLDANDSTSIASSDVTLAKTVRKHYRSVSNELSFLRQMALAAKVVAHVTAPMHKKLLNLCHNWLSTFLPHCLAKVNRVSFGLLSAEDCRKTLDADPHVPRSRLKLAVPFVGKDVPSKSSEFAHPDIIIGLTILAYRYTGLRKDDFIDMADALTAQFSVEIGPARDRESSLRHEKWVYAAGGAIRGLKATKEGDTWNVTGTPEEMADKEVVQLKFLQKSNEEQMDKLFNLIKTEPLVIHYYLQKSIFPLYMRSQRMKIQASGQSVGGDMLVSKRVGFSGTPSDLLPQELGRCDYETGDDGSMLTTVLDRRIASHEYLADHWNVEAILERIATATQPQFNALIDTGALITGYSNKEVAEKLLALGLEWCEGVVFLDDDDKQQVFVRATGRVVSADQCGVSLEKRFAFYDQIHTTGMDIRHVINATAVITLGKDMVFRDYVQGAYRMRQIGVGQKIHVLIIPEVKELMQRELHECIVRGPTPDDHVLEDVVAWLVVNSLRSEQTQWTMLCVQNIGNLYRKNAFKSLHRGTQYFVNGPEGSMLSASAQENQKSDSQSSAEKTAITVSSETVSAAIDPSEWPEDPFVDALKKEDALKVFDESIDFSLDSGVPDPLPFEDRLRSMLDDHEAFLKPEQHAIGHDIMVVVSQFSMLEESANRLDSEQEREQEQEQEKEVEARRDQQIEVEKFVDREYSRQEEFQRPWPFSILAKPINTSNTDNYPFYPLKDFKLRHQEPLEFPERMMISSNYFNPNWTGLRRVKNVIMVMEFAPSTNSTDLRLITEEEHLAKTTLSDEQEKALKKAHSYLGFHASSAGKSGYLDREDLRHAVKSACDETPSDELLDQLITRFSTTKDTVSLDEFRRLLNAGVLYPEHAGRYWVAVSLAEAETIRRILHVRKKKNPEQIIPGSSTELSLHYSPLSSPGAPLAGDGGIVFDATWSWARNKGLSTPYEAIVAHNCFRFFDCDMHFAMAGLNALIRVLKGSVRDRERFFLSTVGCRRRLERKWQETPLAKVFVVPDGWQALKQQAQAVFMIEALKARNMTLWEAFTAIDYDNNGIISPAEFYGALLWLKVPELTADDVVDFIEAADKNKDGFVDYREYMDFLSFNEKPEDGDDEVKDPESVDESTKNVPDNAEMSLEEKSNREPVTKIEPFGGEELREIMLQRRQLEQQRLRDERLRRQAYKDALDVKVFEEELEASKLRKGGANPKVYPVSASVLKLSDEDDASDEVKVTEFRFTTNQHPLRFTPTGKSSFIPALLGTKGEKPIDPFRCPKGHAAWRSERYWGRCTNCRKRGTSWWCNACSWGGCGNCAEAHKRGQEMERRDLNKNTTFLRCMNLCSFTLQLPAEGGPCPITGNYTLSMELRFEKLPPAGQLQSLLRFSLPDIANATRLHRTSVYLNSSGRVVAQPLPTGGEIDETSSKVRAQCWHIISVSVKPSVGMISTYVNGVPCHRQADIDPAELRLQHKVVLLGGGKQAHARGGDIGRIVIHNMAIGDEGMKTAWTALANESIVIGGRALRIQAVYRGFIMRLRKKREEEALEKELEEEREKEKEKEKEKEEEKEEVEGQNEEKETEKGTEN